MDIIHYSAEHIIFRDSLRNYLKAKVTPFADEWEEAGIVPRSAWKGMGEQGFLGTCVPEEYGGSGADFLYSVIVSEEMVITGQGGLMASLHSDIVVPYILSYASEEQKRKYLPGCVSGDIITAVAMTEPNTGSDLAAIKTTAKENGNGIVIDGQKTFISNGINSDLVVVAARDPMIEDAYSAIDLYLVEAGTPGFEKGKKIKKIGLHSQDTSEMYFSDCFIPKTNRLGAKGSGFKILMEKLQQERLVCAIGAVASAEMILAFTITYCKERKAFGKPISKFQNTQFEIAEMATEIKLGKTFVDKLVMDHMENKNVVMEVSMAKYWTTEMVCRVADRCLQLFGGYGYCEEYPIARAWRDTRVTRIYAGSNEIMRNIIAKSMGL